METQILKALLSVTPQGQHLEISRLLKAIADEMPTKMCSLWKINNRAESISVYAREKFSPEAGGNEHEYVHSIKKSLIGYILSKHAEEKKSFYDIPVQEEPFISWHRSPQRVKEMDLRKLISIPIPNYDLQQATAFSADAVLDIYVEDDFTGFNESLAQIIARYFSMTLSLKRLLNREELTREIIKIYGKRGKEDLRAVLDPLIKTVFPKYIKYEGCSVFIWDPFLNKLNLAETTAIEKGGNLNEVSYFVGEGLTGYAAEKKQPVLIKDLENIELWPLRKNYEHKWKETTEHPGKSFMCIPIMSPSRKNDIVGVIRFTNRLNEIGNVVDYFSQEDLDLINHACNLIALYMEYDQSERIRTAFAMQMGHEMLTPAVAIRGTANRLQRKLNTPNFSNAQAFRYLESMQEHANLQIALTRTIEYMWKGSAGKPRSEKYEIRELKLNEDVIFEAKKLVIPIARSEGLTFNNIVVSGSFPSLYLDKYAFQQVFFNLFTNAIKYKDRNSDSFRIRVECDGLGAYAVPSESHKNTDVLKGFLIKIKDEGIGIDKGDEDKIFLMGYRRKNVEKFDVRGLGLGLTVVKRILSDFGGKIYLANNSKPTQFNIFLPEKLNNSKYTLLDDWVSY